MRHTALDALGNDVGADVLPLSDSQAELLSSVNFRDVASHVECIKKGVLYRSSQVVSTTELASLKIQTVLDLRQAPVLCKAQHRNFWQSVKWAWLRAVSFCWCGSDGGEASGSFSSASASAGAGAANQANPNAPQRRDSAHSARGAPLPARSRCLDYMKQAVPCWRCTAECDKQYGVEATVYHVDLLPVSVSLHILLALPRQLQAKVLVCALQGGQPEELVAGAVADPRILGYLRLYQILLDKSKQALARALRLFVDPANLPCLVHCIHGKDRTGVVVMLLLLLCGVDAAAIIKDYALSEELLKEGREKRHLDGIQAYLTTDEVMASRAHVMERTIQYLLKSYGSAYRYALDIGLRPREIAAIRRNLLRDDTGVA